MILNPMKQRSRVMKRTSNRYSELAAQVRKLRDLLQPEYPISGSLDRTIADLLWPVRMAVIPCTTQTASVCTQYGHKPDHRTWQELYPRCSDCGAQIKSPRQLRKS